MRSDSNGIYLIVRTSGKKKQGEKLKWTKINYKVLEQSKGKTLLIPLEGTENYFELLEIKEVNENSVSALLYNYNDWTGGTAFENNVVIKKPTAGQGVKIVNIKSKKLETDDIQHTPIPFCNAVAKKDKLGRINCLKKSFLQNVNYGEAIEKDGKVKIKNIDVSDFKNPKVLMETEETKKTRTLFKHLFGKIKDFSAIEKK